MRVVAKSARLQRVNLLTRALVSTGHSTYLSKHAIHCQQEKNLNLTHIESRPSKRIPGSYEFLVTSEASPEELEATVASLKDKVSYIQVLSRASAPGTDASMYSRFSLPFL